MKNRVLVVDDSATVRAQLVGILSGEFDCATAENGRVALDQVMTAAPDALVADLQMPEMDGLELLRELRSRPSTATLPVVIVTTVTALDVVNECRSLGCAGFVLKPVQRDYLVAKVRQLIKARGRS